MELFDFSTEVSKGNKKSGPPNRINDLNYTDWMKFQKSFFRELPPIKLYNEMVSFFTKGIVDGLPSKSIVFTFSTVENLVIEPRVIETYVVKDLEEIISKLSNENTLLDFVIIDFRAYQNKMSSKSFLKNELDRLYSNLERLLKSERFCCTVFDLENKNGGGFPLAWSVGMKSRAYLRLKDEKVSINENSQDLSYFIISQKLQDERPSTFIPSDLTLSSVDFKVPNFLIPKPPPRNSHEILHPAKYPETLVSQFINIFCKEGGWVLDPMLGTGSTMVAAIKENRNSVGVELSEDFAKICRSRIQHEKRPGLYDKKQSLVAEVFQGNSLKLSEIEGLLNYRFDYVVTSPPYWSMLKNKGSENQKKRRDSKLRTYYSESEDDLGNIEDYDLFLEKLCLIYNNIYSLMNDDSFLTIVIKNVKRNHILYTLAWDLVEKLSKPQGKFHYVGNTLWLQDDINLKPFGIGTHWVSNILHHYCLHFKK